MKYWPTCKCTECLKIHFSFGEKVSDFRARPILGELLYGSNALLSSNRRSPVTGVQIFHLYQLNSVVQESMAEMHVHKA